MRLSPLARWECLSLAASGLLLAAACVVLTWWWALPVVVIAAAAVLLFFRDPNRRPPAQRHAWVAVADGKVTSIHDVDACEPLGGEPAVCVRVFISIFDVHVVRSPAHARLAAATDHAGSFGNALRMLTLHHPVRDEALGAVRLIAGAVARTIVTPIKPGTTLQRGERIGMIKLGSSAELYVPKRLNPAVSVAVGERVKAGESVLVRLEKSALSADQAGPPRPGDASSSEKTQPAPGSSPPPGSGPAMTASKR